MLATSSVTLTSQQDTTLNLVITRHRDRAGLFEEAIKDFSCAIEIIPQNSDFYHNRGFCHRKQVRMNEN